MKHQYALRRLLSYLHMHVRSGSALEPRYYIENDYRLIEVSLSPLDFLEGCRDAKQRVAHAVCHEIGHLLAAPKSRRNKDDYGIPKYALGEPYWDLEDDKASLVEYDLCLRLGVSTRPYLRNLWVETKESARRWWRRKGKYITHEVWTRSQSDFNPKYINDWAVYPVKGTDR